MQNGRANFAKSVRMSGKKQISFGREKMPFSRIFKNRSPLLLAAFFSVAFFLLPAAAQEEEADPAVDAVQFFQKGQDAHEKSNFKEAIELYDKAIAAVAEFPEAEFQRANALLSLGRRDEAEKGFRKAVEIRPEWTLALANLGSILVGKGDLAEAEKFLKKAIALDPQNTLAYSALTELRLRTNASPEELKDLLAKVASLTERAKPTAAAWAARAALENATRDRVSARRSFERALELDPKNQFALTAKASAMLDEGDAAGAEGLINQLRTTDGGNYQVLKARLLHANGRSDEAIAFLNAIQNPSSDVVALRDRLSVSKNENAAELEKQLGKTPDDGVILGKLCSLFRTADPAKALTYCRRASEIEPDDLNHAVGFGAALVQAKLFAEAIELLRKLQRISPDNVTIRANIATALFQLKRYPEAKIEYNWIAEKQPSSAVAYYFLGITHDQLAEYPDAMANYQLFLKHADPEKNKVEIEKVNLRLPVLQKQIKEKKGKKT